MASASRPKTAREAPVLESTLIRLTTLVRGLTPLDGHYRMRTRAVAQGRKPKLKRPLELSAPIFIENDKGKLTMNDNLGLVARGRSDRPNRKALLRLRYISPSEDIPEETGTISER
eukprot:scaffold27521_cov30-Tisochrysis_lutea.AAC.14